MSLVIIPQAMPAIVPPMISLWMNVVKNSSLAIAIGYPDLVSVFMGTSLNQIGHAIEIVGMTMAFYMAPGAAGLFLANGFSGHGMMHSPAVGMASAELLLNGTTDLFDVHPLRLSRFAEGDIIEEKVVI